MGRSEGETREGAREGAREGVVKQNGGAVGEIAVQTIKLGG